MARGAQSPTRFDPALRRRTHLPGLPLERYQLRLATSAAELRAAFALLGRAYVARGLCEAEAGKELRITEQHLLRECGVLVAYHEGHAVGTMSVTADNPIGLPLDGDYGAQLDVMRGEGRRLVELGSLAIDEAHRGGRDILPLLSMAAIWLAARVLQGDRLVIGVNPTAESYYRALYGFRRFGPPRQHAALRAPVVGLAQDLDALARHLDATQPDPMADGRRVHEHHFGALPSCVHVPLDLEGSGRVRLPRLSRQAFRDVFIHEQATLAVVGGRTRAYLQTQRTPDTLTAQTHAAVG